MKRTITTLLTVALVTSLLLGGFAGSAAATQDSDVGIWQDQDVTQVSTSAQDATAVAYDGGSATVDQDSSQANDNAQYAEGTAENTFENNGLIIDF